MTARPVRLGRELVTRLRNEVAARGFPNDAPPRDGIALFFGTGPANLYQFEQWRRPLEELATEHGVFVIVDRPDSGAEIRRRTTLPVVLARGSAALERLVADTAVRVVLYPNQVEANFRMLRFPAPWHVQIGHGESDKDGSSSHQHRAYDRTFVGGQAGRDRLTHALREFDGDRLTVAVGRPQLDHGYPGAPSWPRDGLRVWYAPTWEGDRPSIAYGSLATHGQAIVDALLAEPDVRVIYRPHPRTGTASAAYAAADQAIRDRLGGPDSRHLVDDGEYGWQWAFADACITDISAVAYDWLATGKPLVVTEPAERLASRPPSPLLERLPLLPAARADEALHWLRERGARDTGGTALDATTLAELAAFYFGDTSGRASTRRLRAAIADLMTS